MRRLTRALSLASVAAVAAASLITAPAAQAADGIVIWSDPAHAPVIQELLADGYKGTPVTVVAKDPASVRAELATVTKKNAPDVVWGDLAWTGELAGAGSIVPVPITKKRQTKFRPNVLNGSNVGGNRYGAPVQISNLALISNTKLVPKAPATFAELSERALKLVKNRKKVKIPFALPQGEGASPWSTYPLFSGVGGYLFARTSSGLDVSNVGLASKKLRSNSDVIDGWNASGLIDSSLTTEAAKNAFA